MEKLKSQFINYRRKIKAYNYAMNIIYWDSETIAPKGCFEYRSTQIAVLAEELFKLQTSDEFYQTINSLLDNSEKLDADLVHELIQLKKRIDQVKKVPMDEYIAFQTLLAKSQQIWLQAKEANDFNIFKGTLAEIITYLRKYIKYVETDDLKGYNVLLDMYEPNMTMADYDLFFDELKAKLLPFVRKVLAKEQKEFPFSKQKFDITKQKEFATYLLDVFNFDQNRGLMATSSHPFTTNTSSVDVRITNRYIEDDFISSIFSCAHELGHAIYEQQCDSKYDHTFNSGGASLALHESQSRFYENIIAKNINFWKKHFLKLQSFFPNELSSVSIEEFYQYINKVEASFIRTEADELTYPLHIMLRYDLEKAIFEENLALDELENKWNSLFYEYFGLEVKKISDGLLQDIHWAGGSFGYFPTYALGSAISAQVLYYIKKDLNLDDLILNDDIASINAWLKEKIHKYASSMKAKDILLLAFGEEFSAKYYIDYLIAKYSKIYDIS